MVEASDRTVSKCDPSAVARPAVRRRYFFLVGFWTAGRILAFAAAVVLAALTIAILWLYFLDWNTMRGFAGRYASARLHRNVRIMGDLQVSLFSLTPRVSASDVHIANPNWAGTGEAATLGKLAFRVRLIPLLFGSAIFPEVRFDKPNITVVRDSQGRTNWDLGIAGKSWKVPPIQQFVVSNGHITIHDEIKHLTFAGSVTSQETAGGGNAAFRLSGDGQLNGNTFTAEVHGGPLLHVDESVPYRFRAALRSDETTIIADGQIDRPFHFGAYTAALQLSGTNLSKLYEVTGLAMPQTRSYRLHAILTRRGSLYHLTALSGTVGQSDLRGALDIETGATRPVISGSLTSRVLAFSDLGPLFGGKSALAIRSGQLIPDLPLRTDRLRQMDANLEFSADEVRSQHYPLRQLKAHITLYAGVLSLQPLSLSFASGRLNGTLRIDAQGAVTHTDVDAHLRDIRLEQFVAGTPPSVTGLVEGHAILHGTGNSAHAVASTANGGATFVVAKGSFRRAFAELTGIDLFNGLGLLLSNDQSNTNLRCAVAQFSAHQGVLTAQRFVFDTEPVLVEVKGSIDLNHESIDMSVTGKPKSFRIGRIRSPIQMSGPLSHPRIGVEPGPIAAQTGLAIALGLLFPPAAILPFVEPGLQKDADCIALLREARSGRRPIAAVH